MRNWTEWPPRTAFRFFCSVFLLLRDAYEMAVPDVPLGELYRSELWNRWSNVRFHFRTPVTAVNGSCRFQSGEERQADYYVLAVPFERAGGFVPSDRGAAH